MSCLVCFITMLCNKKYEFKMLDFARGTNYYHQPYPFLIIQSKIDQYQFLPCINSEWLSTKSNYKCGNLLMMRECQICKSAQTLQVSSIQCIISSIIYKYDTIKRNESHVAIFNFDFSNKSLVHLKCYILIPTSSQSDIWLQRYEHFFEFKNNVKHKNLSPLLACNSKSIFPTSDSFPLIMSQMPYGSEDNRIHKVFGCPVDRKKRFFLNTEFTCSCETKTHVWWKADLSFCGTYSTLKMTFVLQFSNNTLMKMCIGSGTFYKYKVWIYESMFTPAYTCT